jgi:high frequency lysogenization protein
MQHTDRERVIALAGLVQALQLVQQVAYARPRDTDALEASIGSIFKLDADSAEDVYGGLEGLRLGLRLLIRQLGGTEERPDLELTRYAVSIVHLERKLNAKPELLQRLRTGIELALAQADHFSLVHENVIANLADSYKNTVSSLTPRVMVNGDPRQLHQPEAANWIRALLLAAMRAAVLWRQAGGSRWRLLLGRKALVRAAEGLVEESRPGPG